MAGCLAALLERPSVGHKLGTSLSPKKVFERRPAPRSVDELVGASAHGSGTKLDLDRRLARLGMFANEHRCPTLYGRVTGVTRLCAV
jgi:hypothetical protein